MFQVTEQASLRDALADWFPGELPPNLKVMKTNVSSANYWAVANGAGIGVFPSYALALGGKIVPLDIEFHRPVDIWLSYHPGSGQIPRVRYMIDWLVEVFNSRKYPWFRDEFVHPSELKSVYKGKSLAHLFGGFSTEGLTTE